jgi:hypothetical protein
MRAAWSLKGDAACLTRGRNRPSASNLLNPDDTMLYSSRGNAGVAMPPSSQRPTSPTFSMATTQASAVNINGGPEIIITRAHLRTSVLAYEEVRI